MSSEQQAFNFPQDDCINVQRFLCCNKHNHKIIDANSALLVTKCSTGAISTGYISLNTFKTIKKTANAKRKLLLKFGLIKLDLVSIPETIITCHLFF